MNNRDKIQAKGSIEAKRMLELLTPLSIIMALQLTLFLYFLDQGWKTGFDLVFPFAGLVTAWGALTMIVVFAIWFRWTEEDINAVLKLSVPLIKAISLSFACFARLTSAGYHPGDVPSRAANTGRAKARISISKAKATITNR